MIAKRIDAEKSHHNARGLGNYIRDADHKGEKCLMAWHEGCWADDYELALLEIEATQALNPRSTSNKTYHLMVSFRPEDETILLSGTTADQLRTFQEIERKFAEALGLAGHQRLCGVHRNTNNLHMHVAYNLIHPEKLTINVPYQDFPKLSRACREIENEYGLMVDNGIEASNPAEPKITQRAAAMEAHSGEQSFQAFALEQREKILIELQTAMGWQDVHRILADHGIAIKPRANGLVLVNPTGKGAIKASALDRSMARGHLEKRFGNFVEPDRQPYVEQDPGGQVAAAKDTTEQTGQELEQEKGSGEPSFQDSALSQREKILTELQTAVDWQDVHRILAGHNMAIRPRGNGFVLMSLVTDEMIKASALDRSMAKGYLEKRFGAFVAPESGQQEKPNQKRTAEGRAYQKKPRQPRSPERDQLYKDYQTALAEKIARIDAEKARTTSAHVWLKILWQESKTELYATPYMSRRTRAVRMRMMLQLHRQEVLREKADHKSAMAEIKKDYPWYNWNGYLQHQAMQGNIVALDVLRSQEQRKADQAAIRHPAKENIWLDVPFADKDAAKEAGARWDREEKRWYAPKGADLDLVRAWLPAGMRPPESEQETDREKNQAATDREAMPKDVSPVMWLLQLERLEKKWMAAGTADKAYFRDFRMRIDNRGVVIITLASGGTIRDAGSKLHFSVDEDSRQAARLYAQARFGRDYTEKGNSIKKSSTIWRMFRPGPDRGFER